MSLFSIIILIISALFLIVFPLVLRIAYWIKFGDGAWKRDITDKTYTIKRPDTTKYEDYSILPLSMWDDD
jgi:hypothetical protein